MSSSSNDKNSVNFDFDLDSILSEFGALDEEPVSEKPFFEPSVPVMDTSKKSDQVFSAVVNDGFEASAPQDGFDFDATQIIEEFEAEDDGAESTSKLDPERIRREFESDDAPVEINAAKSESVEPAGSAMPDSGSELDEVERIIDEFKHFPRPQGRIIEPEPVREPAQSEPEPTKQRDPDASISAKTFEPPVSAAEQTKLRDEASGEQEQEAEQELYEGSGINEDTGDKYAADADYTVIEPEPPKKEKARKEPKSFRESVAVPVISALAFIAMKIKQSQVTLGETSYESEDLGEEMQPDKAARFYDKHIAGLRLRTRIAFVLCVLMAYISYGLPVPGALADAGVKSAVCLIMMISVMFCGLDIITTGIMSIVRFKLHASALIAISCLLCTIDAFLSAASVSEKVVPFCVIPALTIAFTLLGSVMNARSNKIILNTAAASKHPYVVTAEESVFGVLTPYFVVAALVLSIIAAVISKDFSSFAHILSGIFVCAAPIAMLITFPMPFFISIKSLIRSGSTIAGWSGLYDIGKAKHLIVTDGDLFPKGCVKISRTRVFAGMEPERIISFAGSIISASGSAMVHPFAELMRKAGGGLMPVEAFSVHESGGLTAMIDGEDVYCGNAAFMRLMGVVLNNGVYIAVAGVICGVFEMEYTASDAVKSALEELVGSDRHAIFAVRDFNITPSMLSVKFDMPTDGFDFPPYSERYAISGTEPSEASKPAALISREGLSALVSLADHGKMLFSRIRLSVMLSVVSAVVGMLVMFILSLSALPSVVTALSYLLAWLLITVILSFSISTP